MPSEMNIFAHEREYIDKHLLHWYDRRRLLRAKCPHTNVKKEHKSGGGGWSTQETYWINFNCPDCGRFWTEDQ